SEAAMGSKLLELLMEIAPGVRRVAMIFNPDTAPRSGAYYFSEFEAAARISKVEPIAARVRSDVEIETVLTSLGRGSDNGLVVMPDYFMPNHSQAVISLAAQSNVPAIYPWKFVVT